MSVAGLLYTRGELREVADKTARAVSALERSTFKALLREASRAARVGGKHEVAGALDRVAKRLETVPHVAGIEVKL